MNMGSGPLDASIIIRFKLEVVSRMIAYRANLGSLLTYYDMTAVAALPDAVTVSREYDLVFDILE